MYIRGEVNSMKYDVFISHASEDKADFVHPLAEGLGDIGLSVWYDEFTLRLGDNLTESINNGLSDSTFGLVIISQNYFRKPWPKRELSALISREDTEGKVILPIWYDITKDEVLASFPLIVDKFAIKVDKFAGNSKEVMTTVIQKILEVVKPDMIAEEHYKNGLMFEKNKLPDEAKVAYFKTLRINQNHPDALRRINHISINQNSHYVWEITIKTGTISTITDKGYGFIDGEDGKVYFVHHKDFKELPTTHIGYRVAFLVVNSKYGVNAMSVRII
jgi:cold shock CspA family protein